MTREMARGICQHFMDAHLIENAADLTSPNFKERGVYMVTPKGTHMLERFITKNGISATHIAHIFAEQPIYVKMLHLERRSSDDDVIISKTVIDVIWRRVAGPKPNLTKLTEDELSTQLLSRWFNKPQKMEEINVEDGLIVRKVAKEDAKKSGSAAGGGGGDEYHFTALGLTNWLVDFTSCGGLDEAAELAGHLVRYGLISLVHDRGKVKENNYVANVKAGGAGGGAGAMHVSPPFPTLPVSAMSDHNLPVARGRIPCDRKGSVSNHARRHDYSTMDRSAQTCHFIAALETEAAQPRFGRVQNVARLGVRRPAPAAHAASALDQRQCRRGARARCDIDDGR